MTFLPIVERELRVAARWRATYWARAGAALAALAMCVYIYLATSAFGSSQLGPSLFEALVWISFLYCLMAGVRLTADCLSAEKRDGTLGLLFLTDLKGYDIVLGKLAASSTRAFYGLLAVFPVLGAALLFGGVSGTQFSRSALVLLNTMFFSLTVGMFASVWFENGRKAAALTFLILLVITMGPVAWFAYVWQGASATMMQPPFAWLIPSPAFALMVAAAPATRAAVMPNHLLWVSVAMTHLSAWCCLAVASTLLPRAWQDRPASIRSLHWRARWKQWGYGDGLARAAFRRRLLNRNPFLWLAARDRLKPIQVWVFLSLVSAICLYGWLYHQSWRDSSVLALISAVVHGILKFWMGTVVVQRLAEDRQNGTLELILSTPIATREVFSGQRRALLRQFGWGIAVVLVADIFFWRYTMATEYSDRPLMTMLYGAHDIILLADVYVISWLGLWMAVTAKGPNHAAAATLQRVLVIPWLVFITVAIAHEVIMPQRQWGWSLSDKSFLAIWFALGLINDIAFMVYAKRQLRGKFRAAVTERPAGGLATFWGWLTGGR